MIMHFIDKLAENQIEMDQILRLGVRMTALHTVFAQRMLDFLIVTFQDSEITLHTNFSEIT